MYYQYIPIIWPLSISGLLTLSLGIFAQLKRRKAQGVGFFVLSMFIVTFWSIPNALEMAAVELPVKLFWANMQYFAYCFSPVSLLFLCMAATGHSYEKHKSKLRWLIVLPSITLILVWTNQWHGLIRYDVHLTYQGTFSVIAKKYGAFFYIHAAYSHWLNLWAVAVLLRTIYAKGSVYKKQAIRLLIGTSLIIIPNLIYILGISPFRFDITPMFFGPAGVIILWSIFHNRMFELVPMARTAVIEAMDAGVMVMDIQDRILDMNPAFKKIIGSSMQKYYLRSIDEVCIGIPELIRIIKDGKVAHTDFSIIGEKETRVFEILLIPLYDKEEYIGRLTVLHDITEKKQAQQEFLKQQWQLAVIDERERISRDLHDNLGQVLGFINLQAQAIRQELVNEGVDLVYDKLDRLIKVTQQMHSEIREYIASIRTSVIAERDFITSLKNDILNFEQQTGLQVKLDISEEASIEKAFDSSVKVNIQNIIREALNNIRKHAQADEVYISFHMDDKHMTVSIADNGKGFYTVKKDDTVKNKFGLDIMRERAALIGGHLSIESEPDKGSRIRLYMPRKGDDKYEYESDAG